MIGLNGSYLLRYTVLSATERLATSHTIDSSFPIQHARPHLSLKTNTTRMAFKKHLLITSVRICSTLLAALYARHIVDEPYSLVLAPQHLSFDATTTPNNGQSLHLRNF